MLQTYQHLAEYIDPIAATVGSFSIRWYSLMYLVGFAVVYFLLRYRIKRGEHKTLKFSIFNSERSGQSSSADQLTNSQLTNLIFDLLIYCFIGLLVGARLGYVIFYDPSYFLDNPLEIFIPFYVNGQWLIANGFYGMSYFGGLAGAVVSGYVFAKKNKLNFRCLADFLIPAVPAGYFFGRIGNFLNGELYGRPTESFLGMYFSGDSNWALRHPAQLYEAFLEGAALFAVLWLLRNNEKKIARRGFFPLYLFGYGFVRFWAEFFRDPLFQGEFFSWLSQGQVLALIIMALAVVFWKKQKKVL